ncbi:MAG TPA: DNA-directed RNA polymerase subunit beta', partial [Thermoanaerobaculia bacterium]|nr:DNA-directed RNA polymerase subunit beta' [Thermoanaerobaculia bacterium]
EAVGVIAAQSIGEPGTQLTMRTFHYGGTASRVSEQSKHISKNPGVVKFLNVNTVESRRGSLIVINRSGKLVITDEKGRERERYALTYGSQLLVHEGDMVEPGTELVTWDPFTYAILSEIGGRVEFQDIVEGENVREETDKVTGLSQKIIVEASANEKRVPAILIHGEDGREKRYLLPSGSHLVAQNGSDVFAGDTMVKIPRETTKTKDITGGLPRVVELFEARSPKEPAIITEIDGVVHLGDVHKGMRKVQVESDMGDTREYLVPRSIHINVQEGERVRAGDPLIDGAINPHDVLQVLGEKELQRYMTDKIQEVYRSQSVAINDKHIEVIVRQMMRSVKIEEVGDTEFLIDEQVDRWKFQEENERVVAAGGTPAIGRPLLLGITKASLSTDSFISAASFQETTRVLTEAAISGKVDGLRGLKENVIVGRVIPAGTGMHYYHDFHMAEEYVESEPETEEELFFEFGEEEIRSLPQEVLEGD